MTSRQYYDMSQSYIEPNEYGGWDWGFYNVPVNRGPQVMGRAMFRWTARLHLWMAKRIARKYGFRP